MPDALAPSSRNVDAPTETLTDEQLAAMVWREVRGTGTFIARMRLVVVVIITLVVALLLAFDLTRWRLWVMGAVAVVVIPVVVRDYLWLKKTALVPRHLPYLLIPVIVLHTAIILITGGAESPFLVLYVVVGMAPAMTIGRFKPFLALASVPIALLWLFTVGAVTGALPNLTPEFFGPHGFGSNAAYTYTQAVVFTIATVLGGTVIVAIRAAVERSARTAAAMRHELLSTVRERNRELLSLSAELAHELKNPLASILGLSTVVERKLAADSKEREQMQVLVSEAKRMSATLDEFLNFSRPVTGLSAKRVRPRELMDEVAQLHEGLALQRGFTMTVSAEPADAIRCDPRKVKQVLVNLLHNALEATERGGAIELRTEPGPDGGARFIVQDSGPGIAEEVRERLFQPGITTKSGGSGLGLTIARAIAEQHGGSLTLEEPDEGGCRAVLSLPSQPAAQANEGEPS